MKHPWEEISLKDYEAHMSLDAVQQLQTMNQMMRRQFTRYPAETLMILGIAGGNGLEHIGPQMFRRVYGVDINAEYLRECGERHPQLKGVLELVRADLTALDAPLPHAGLLVANLLVEYIGYACFQAVVREVGPRYVSCGIQINTDKEFVSDSPYLYVFDRLNEVHHQMEEETLNRAMEEIGYPLRLREEYPLPNGKKLVRLDFEGKFPEFV